MLALYIGNERIKIVQGSYRNKTLKIKKSGTKEFDTSLSKATAFKAEEKINMIVPAIYNCLNENKIRQKVVDVVVDDEQALYRELVVPRSTRSELKSIVYNEMSQILSDIGDYVIDYQVAYAFLHNNVTMYKISITALTKTAYVKYVNIIKSAALKIRSLNISSNSFTDLMRSYGNYLSDLPYILVDIEDSFVNLILFEQGMRIMSRSIDMSVQLAGNKSVFLNALSEHLSRLMQFQMTQKNRKPVSRLYLTGMIPGELYLENRLSEKFNLGIGVLPRPPFMKNSEYNVNKYSNVIGAMLR